MGRTSYVYRYWKCCAISLWSKPRREGKPFSGRAKFCTAVSKVRIRIKKVRTQKFFTLNIQMAKTRRSRGKKGTRKLSSWNLLVMKTFKELKAKNKDASFSDALKEASRRKK
jgi:hypothetical protein